MYGEAGPCDTNSSAKCILSMTLFKGIDSVTFKRGWAVIYNEQVFVKRLPVILKHFIDYNYPSFQVYHLSPNNKMMFGSISVYRTHFHLYMSHKFIETFVR